MTMFNNRCAHHLLAVQPQNVSDMRVKVVQTDLCGFQEISRLLRHNARKSKEMQIRSNSLN
jgi:hypothetical protein